MPSGDGEGALSVTYQDLYGWMGAEGKRALLMAGNGGERRYVNEKSGGIQTLVVAKSQEMGMPLEVSPTGSRPPRHLRINQGAAKGMRAGG